MQSTIANPTRKDPEAVLGQKCGNVEGNCASRSTSNI